MWTALLGLLLPSPIGQARAAVAPNPYAPSLPSQASFAIGQSVARGFRRPLSRMTGSEADAPDELAAAATIGAPLGQFVSGHHLPPSMFTPNLPRTGSLVGDGTGPQTGPYKGWVTPTRTGWGNTKGRHPIIVASTLLDPKERTPTPQAMAEGYVAANAGATRLEDVFGD